MMGLFRQRRQDTFRTDKENGFRKFFRNWLSVDGFGICRNRRSQMSQDHALADKQATESVKDVPHLKSASIATESSGDIDLYLTLKRRSEQSLSDLTDEPETGRNRSAEGSGKAVQE